MGSAQWVVVWCFFFQAEDGIRDLTVTGVQTCALPISERRDGRCPPRRRDVIPDLLGELRAQGHCPDQGSGPCRLGENLRWSRQEGDKCRIEPLGRRSVVAERAKQPRFRGQGIEGELGGWDVARCC